MKFLIKIAVLTSVFTLTACASPIQSKIKGLKDNNFTLLLTSNAGLLSLQANYKSDTDKIYAKLGSFEVYVFKENNQYKRIARLTENSAWLVENATKADFEEGLAELLPFTTDIDDAWFVREPNSTTYEVIETKLGVLVNDPDVKSSISSAAFVIESNSIKFTYTTSNSILSTSNEYHYTKIGSTSFSIPNYL
jgi:hypothetical protein